MNVARLTSLAAVLLTLAACGSGAAPPPEGTSVHLAASGQARLESGPYYSGNLADTTGDITVDALDTGGRGTPLPPHDQLSISARFTTPSGSVEVTATDPMVEDPMGRWTTWWGVGIDVDHHGKSGIGSDKVPRVVSPVAAFGMGDVSINGKKVASAVPVHVMTADSGLPGRLELDVGDPAAPISALPDGHFRVVWADYQGAVPTTDKTERYVGGGIVLVLLVIGALLLARTPRRRVA